MCIKMYMWQSQVEIRNGIMFDFYPGLLHISTPRVGMARVGQFVMLHTAMFRVCSLLAKVMRLNWETWLVKSHVTTLLYSEWYTSWNGDIPTPVWVVPSTLLTVNTCSSQSGTWRHSRLPLTEDPLSFFCITFELFYMTFELFKLCWVLTFLHTLHRSD